MTELLTRCGAYTYFGAHPAETGYVFRVWAPHARAVALAGDFNGWQSAAMTRLDGGVWELTQPDAKIYDGYKYVITGADGRTVWKADPYAFHAATRPGTDSKVYDSRRFQGAYEIVSLTGTVDRMAEEFYAHLHLSAAGADNQVVGGHLNRAVISATGELVLTRIAGELDREKSPEVGLNLWAFR